MNSSNKSERDTTPYRFPGIPFPNPREKPENRGEFRSLKFENDGSLTDPIKIAAEKAKEIEKNAYDRGFASGEKNGVLSGTEKLDSAVKLLGDLVARLNVAEKEVHRNAEKEAVILAMAIAEKIVSHEVATNREVVVGIVREALKNIVDQNGIKIRLNPEDFEFLNGARPELSDLVDHVENIVFEADDAIGRGGCLIETDFGNIDARIEQKIELVKMALESELAESTGTNRE